MCVASCQCSTPADGGSDGGGGPVGGSGSRCSALFDPCTTSDGCCTGLSCDNGSCRTPPTGECGLNSLMCNGVCSVVLTDPANCGGCGRACGTGQVCLSGACVATSNCPQSTTACMGQCVDLSSSNQFCGSCSASAACGPGQGCSQGSCVETVPLNSGGVQCAGGGPPVMVTGDAGTMCSANIAQVTFRWALCSCTNISASSMFKTDGFDSTRPYVDGGSLLGAGVGANGAYSASSGFDIGGTGWIGGTGGVNISTASDFRQELHVNGQCSGGESRVGSNAYINGNVSDLTIGGTLFVPSIGNVGSGVNAAAGTTFGPVSVPPPCDCANSQLIDVAGIVNHGSMVNDNAAIGLSPTAMAGSGARRLDLPCGRYYLTEITPNASATIAVHGRTALFVGGNISLSNDLDLLIDPNAELDIYIGGNVSASSGLKFGSTIVPAQLRVYIAGNTVSMSSGALLAGNFYMPWANYGPSANIDIYGSIFCKSFSTSSEFNMHYDRGVLTVGRECPNAAPDAGSSGCSSCRDCGNQACVNNQCSACTSDSQCCAPLLCVGGVCQSVIIN